MPMLDAGDVSLSYEVSGEAGDAIVFVHAIPVTRTMWNPQVEALARTRRVVVYDCRGFGQSDAPSREEAYSQTRSVDDLKAVLRATSPNGAVICGLSMGGISLWNLRYLTRTTSRGSSSRARVLGLIIATSSAIA